MPTKLVLTGVAGPSDPEEVLVADGSVRIQTKAVINLNAGTRGDQPPIPLEAQDDDLVEIEYMDGGREWMRVDTLRSRLGAAGTRGAAPATLIMPAQMPIGAPTTTRGAPDLWIKTIKLLNLVSSGQVDAAVNQIVQQIEAKLTPGPGLYQLQLDGSYGAAQLVTGELAASKRPYLILIHGTFSSIGAAYAALFQSSEWRQLYETYAGRVYGFNHRTLSESPVENALALLEHLPRDAHLHLVSHSRGGLVGELLCLNEIKEEHLVYFHKAKRDAEIERLRQLSTLLVQKHLLIDRFVRVACPAAGTLLASRRLDRYLSVMLNLAELTLGGGAAFLGFMKANILTLIQKRAEPQQLPGLEAQVPEAPLVALLNRAGVQCNADLAVIAGDCQISSDIVQSLKVLAGDAFYWEEHDLVVNTKAMARGVERKAGYQWFTTGASVAHSNYFANEDSRRRVYRWLTHTAEQQLEDFEGFTPIRYRDPEDVRLRGARTVDAQTTRAQSGLRDDVATVVLIPGLFGSELRKDGKPLWLDLAALTEQGLQPLALPATDEAISVGDVIMPHYQPLAAQLRQQFNLMPFAYDWRQSLVTAAQALATQLNAELTQHNQPIHLLAHASGGLVARLMIAQYPALWSQLKARGGHLVLAGTPHQGMLAAVELLGGLASLTRLLGYVDPALDAAGVSDLFWHFPGLVELLPHDAKVWRTTWNKVAERQTAAGPALPKLNTTALKNQLSAAAKVWKLLDAPQPGDAICQVVGAATWTPSTFALDDAGELVFAGHNAGDGNVAHQSAWLEGVPIWRIEAEHSDLLNYPPAFAGLIELLVHGTTTQLPTAPQSTRGDMTRAELVQRQFRPVLFPTQADLLHAALGATPNNVAADADKPVILHLSVLNASLEHATLPLAVGHYQGDVLVGAEAVLDERLKNKLSYRQAMNLYPGPIGTVEVVLAPDLSPPGALVIGLGEVGSLTAEVVTEGIYQAALRLALARLETTTKGKTPLSVAFSALLIGSRGAYALSIESSLAAIVSGVLLANRTLRQRKLLDQVQIDKIQFVEIYEDLATHAAHALNEIERHLRLALTPSEQLAIEPHLLQGEGGYTGQAAFDFDNGWWRRVQITEQPVAQPMANQTAEANATTAPGTAAKPFGRALQYVLLTDRARAELTVQPTQRTLVERLVEKSIQTVTTDLALPATLYELLLPNELKSQPLETANLLLVLDEHAAQYPWEMLAQRPLSDSRARSQSALRPLAVQKGLLRQLTTATYRVQVQPPSAKKALVIGEPRVTDEQYGPLPGARAEATTVAQVLERHGYTVDVLIDQDALTIVNTLFAGDYRIIHIAGHGIYRPDSPAQSGVVLGDNIFLTAAEIAQLPVVPELVFLNCCYGGVIDQARPGSQASANSTTNVAPAWNKLAASVAQELIKIGVRAVVAAGWAVNDRAAEFFARTLYERMVDEKTPSAYGEAVRYARQQLFEDARWRATNTWGAYQCYGDPGFLLNPTVSRSGMQPQKPVAPQEVVRQLRNYQARASRYHSTALLNQLKEAIIQLEKLTPPNWLNGELHNEFGDTYGEVGDFVHAIAHYREARQASSPKERVPIRCIEQLANLTARYAMQRHLHPADQNEENQGKRWTPDALLDESEKLLKLLLVLADNAEHNALYASYYKRLAVVRTGEQRTKALKASAKYYEKAYKAPGKRNEVYWQSNMILCRIVADEDFTAAEQRDCLAQVEQLEATAQQGLGPHATYWERVAVPDLAVIHLLLDSLLEHKTITNSDFAPIEAQYHQAIDIGSTVRERLSTFDTLEFLIHTLPQEKYGAFVTALEGLAQSLMQEKGEAVQGD